jgi:hypothetical protein
VSLDALGWGSVADFLGKISDKLWPDPLEKAKGQVMLLEMQQRGEFKAIDAMLEQGRQQTEINKVEAASASFFVAGWRPFVGWVCGGAFAYNFVVQPLLQFLAVVGGLQFDVTLLPTLSTGEIIPVLTGMLGFGAMRTYEKYQGVAASPAGPPPPVDKQAAPLHNGGKAIRIGNHP